jgi:hypothetical protein
MQSANLLEAARTLGASRAAAFFRVALPLARPALAVGLSLALLETLNDIGASEFLGIRTLTVSIYTTWVTRGSIEGASQIALFMLAIVLLILAVERRGRRRQAFAGRAQSRPPRPTQLRGWQAAGHSSPARCRSSRLRRAGDLSGGRGVDAAGGAWRAAASASGSNTLLRIQRDGHRHDPRAGARLQCGWCATPRRAFSYAQPASATPYRARCWRSGCWCRLPDWTI